MNFDLNTENYSRDELIQMFELPIHFDKNIIEIKESKLRESILNNNDINKETQAKTINFLVKAKNIILNDEKNQNRPFQQKIEDFYNSSYELKSSKLEDTEEHMLQVRPEKPYLSSFPSEFFPGVINPLKKKTIKKNLNIDSRFRENYYSSTSTNYNLTLPTNFNDIVQMQLSSIEIPTTYYVVSKQYGNNFFTLTVNSSTTIINIPDGNYSQNTIMNAINNQLVLAGSPFDKVVFAINLANGISGSGQTMVGFSDLSGNTILELNFQADKYGIDDRNTPLPLKFGWLLGFRNGIYVNNLNYVSEGVVDISGPRYLFLVVDDHNNSVNNSFYSAFNSSILNKNILARISLQANPFNILQQNNLNIVTTPRDYFGPVNLTNMTIQLLDEYGRIVDINNMDFSFCITLTTIYDI
jgi:hypothetical protein